MALGTAWRSQAGIRIHFDCIADVLAARQRLTRPTLVDRGVVLPNMASVGRSSSMRSSEPQALQHIDRTALDVLRAAIRAGQSGGATAAYYAAEAWWQAPLRQRCARLVTMIATGSQGARDEGVALLREVNGRYRTRHPQAALPELYDDFHATLCKSAWLGSEAPRLLESDDDAVQEIADTYLDILRLNTRRGYKRPFSLLTKYLHLCFPVTFVIYDGQAARSVLTWSQHAFPSLPALHPERLQFDADNRHWVRHWDDRGWYVGLLRFYRLLWAEAQQSQLTDDLARLQFGLQQALRGVPGAPEARLTVVDVIDSLLWQANGDPAILGLQAR